LCKNRQNTSPMQDATADISVEFKLGNGTVSSGHMFDTEDISFARNSDERTRQETRPLQIVLDMISDENTLAELKRCWCKDMDDSDQCIGVDVFFSFIKAAEKIALVGEKYKQFARNMVKKGLLGEHSLAITRQPLGAHLGDCGQRIAWEMLVALASESGCEARVLRSGGQKADVTLCSANDPGVEGYVSRTDYGEEGIITLINEGYRRAESCGDAVPGSMIGKLAIRCNIMGDAVGLDGTGRMGVLGWFLHSLKVSSLSVGSEFKITSADMHGLGKLSQEMENWMALEELDISRCPMLGCEYVEVLVPKISFFKELVLRAEKLTPEAAEAFRGCTRLEKLDIYGAEQDSEFVEALVAVQPMLKELVLRTEKLNPEAAEAFRGCTRLEKLCLIVTPDQSSAFVGALVRNLPSLKELQIRVERLGLETAEAFRGCVGLERLVFDGNGSCQSSAFVGALVRSLPFLRELQIRIDDELSLETAEAFGGCVGLERLFLYEDIYANRPSQSSSFAEVLARSLPSLKELWIRVERLSPEAAEAFRACRGLERLTLRGSYQSSSFFEAVLPELRCLRELDIGVEGLDVETAEAFRGCAELEVLALYGSGQTSLFVEAVVPQLPSLRRLKIGVDEELGLQAVESLKRCRGLESLEIMDELTPECIERILSPPTGSLKYVAICKDHRSLSDREKRAVSAAERRGISVMICDDWELWID
jgi:hypothetical protein